MSVGAYLRRLDDKVVPDRGRGRYDAPRPLWLMYGGLVGAIAGVAFGAGLFSADGVLRVVVCVAAATVLAAYLVAAILWTRAHRVRTHPAL